MYPGCNPVYPRCNPMRPGAHRHVRLCAHLRHGASCLPLSHATPTTHPHVHTHTDGDLSPSLTSLCTLSYLLTKGGLSATCRSSKYLGCIGITHACTCRLQPYAPRSCSSSSPLSPPCSPASTSTAAPSPTTATKRCARRGPCVPLSRAATRSTCSAARPCARVARGSQRSQELGPRRGRGRTRACPHTAAPLCLAPRSVLHMHMHMHMHPRAGHVRVAAAQVCHARLRHRSQPRAARPPPATLCVQTATLGAQAAALGAQAATLRAQAATLRTQVSPALLDRNLLDAASFDTGMLMFSSGHTG